jgi:hypothetical protein
MRARPWILRKFGMIGRGNVERQKPRGRRAAVGLVIFGMMIGALVISPAGAHVGGTVSHLWRHLRPKADARYANAVAGTDKAKNANKLDGRDSTDFMSSTLRLGETLTGGYAASGTTAQSSATATIDFVPHLPAAIAHANVVYNPSGNTNCPGQGQAAPGYLCIYPTWVNSMTFSTYGRPTDNLINAGTDQLGVVLFFDPTADSGNTRGSWAVSPAATSTASSSVTRSPSEKTAVGYK